MYVQAATRLKVAAAGCVQFSHLPNHRGERDGSFPEKTNQSAHSMNTEQYPHQNLPHDQHSDTDYDHGGHNHNHACLNKGCLKIAGIVAGAFAVLILFVLCSESKSSREEGRQMKTGSSDMSNLTELSRKAARLQNGMPRSKVILLLGRPDWVIVPTDVDEDWECPRGVALCLVWRNGRNYPVIVDFDPNYSVCGWEEGRYEIAGEIELELPPDRFLSTNPGRQQFASP